MKPITVLSANSEKIGIIMPLNVLVKKDFMTITEQIKIVKNALEIANYGTISSIL